MANEESLSIESPIPLWAQLAATLRLRIERGEFDAKVPSEPELSREYSVSRATVREALRALRTEGLIQSIQGRGTFVSGDPWDKVLTSGYSLAESIANQGMQESSKVLIAGVCLDEEASELLQIEPGSGLVEIKRIRFASGQPVAIDHSFLSLRIAEPLLELDLTSGSLYKQLYVHCGLRVTSGVERLRAVQLFGGEAELLEMSEGDPVIEIERLAYVHRQPVELRRTLLCADRFQFYARWGTESSA